MDPKGRGWFGSWLATSRLESYTFLNVKIDENGPKRQIDFHQVTFDLATVKMVPIHKKMDPWIKGWFGSWLATSRLEPYTFLNVIIDEIGLKRLIDLHQVKNDHLL